MKYIFYTFLILVFSLQVTVAQFESHEVKLPHCNSPKDVQVADVDGDGFEDIIVGSDLDNRISWFKNEGDNTFKWQHMVTNELPSIAEVYAVDVDLDGDIDVIAESSEYNFEQEIYVLLWYENDGEGNFTTTHNISNLAKIYGTTVADLDGDGDIDILVGDDATKSIVWYDNDGSGRFVQVIVSQDEVSLLKHIVAKDFNQDGHLDILVTTDYYLGIFLNDGNENFGELSNLPTDGSQSDNSTIHIVAVDIDSDGDIDLLTAKDNNNRIFLRENDGAGNFSVPVQIVVPLSGKEMKTFEALDMNHDGRLDILTSTEDSEIKWYEQSEEGTFHSPTDISTYERVTHISLEDVDGDSDKDIVTLSRYNDAVEWLENKGEEGFELHLVTANWKNRGNLEFEDLNQDSYLDLCTFEYKAENYLLWYEFNELGGFSCPKILDVGSGYKDHQLIDLNNDGLLDIVVSIWESDPMSKLLWFENLGNGNFDKNPLPIEFRGLWECADLDNNDTKDLIVIDSTVENLIWYSGDGAGNFENPQIIEVEDLSSIRNIVAIADTDNNGTKDLWLQFDTFLALYSNLGGGNFSHSQTVAEYETFQKYNFYYKGDVDGDALWDMTAWFQNTLFFYKNQGNGTFAEGIVIFGKDANAFSIEDINKDGLLDILTTTDINTIDYTISWHANSGFGNFLEAIPLGHFTSPVQLSEYVEQFVLDLNLDGDNEIIISNNSFSDNLIIFENSIADSFVKGTVYWDENENKTRDENEIGLLHQRVDIEPDFSSTTTNALGDFYFWVNSGNYSLSYPSNHLWELSSDNSPYEVSIQEGVQAPNVMFGVKPVRILNRVDIFLTGAPTRCNQQVAYWLNYSNTGTTIANGTVTLEFDELMGFISSNPQPDVIEGNTLTWNFSELYPSYENKIQLQFQMPDFNSMGEILETQATVQVFNDNQELVYSKTTDYKSEVRCSYDPNDKLARSNILGQSEFAYLQDTILYTVRFQNTGNDTAFNIRIEDILDKKLDWTTFHPITASHDYRTELNRETGLVTFYFDDILLPDSTTNEPESHGFVMFGIASLENLEDKIEVDNTASIFFDFNPPIITNTATLTLLRGDVGIEGIDNSYSISVRPNPFSDYTTIEVNGLSLSGNYRLEVRDILGRKLKELIIDNEQVIMERGDLASGLYLIQVLESDSNRILGSGKVLVE